MICFNVDPIKFNDCFLAVKSGSLVLDSRHVLNVLDLLQVKILKSLVGIQTVRLTMRQDRFTALDALTSNLQAQRHRMQGL